MNKQGKAVAFNKYEISPKSVSPNKTPPWKQTAAALISNDSTPLGMTRQRLIFDDNSFDDEDYYHSPDEKQPPQQQQHAEQSTACFLRRSKASECVSTPHAHLIEKHSLPVTKHNLSNDLNLSSSSPPRVRTRASGGQVVVSPEL